MLATLLHRPVCIDQIHSHAAKPGLRDFEVSLLQLLDKVTNGARIEINETATKVRYRPGSLVGASSLLCFWCAASRSVVYWLEPLLVLLLFAREKQSAVTLYGATYHELDVSVDCVRSVLIPMLKLRFGATDIRIDLKRRALAPSGGGEVRLTVGSVHALRTIDLTDCGMIKVSHDFVIC